MRILHTSDWHAGKLWKGIQRDDELIRITENLSRYIEKEAIDLVLLTGDLFDSSSPPARAEQIVFEFFRRVGLNQVPIVAIAGNHDNPQRFDAWAPLAEFVGVKALGRPRPAAQGGSMLLVGRSGERATVAAMPFAPPRLFVPLMEAAQCDTKAHQTYADKCRWLATDLASSFRSDTVNVFISHNFVDGAVMGGSERVVHTGEQWALAAQSLPSTAQYVGLGHIHKPQKIESASAPTYYAGSPLQLDFGEIGDHKTFVVIDVKPGLPAKIERIPYEGGIPLNEVRAELAEIESRRDELNQKGYLRVLVKTDTADSEINRRVRNLLPRAVSVQLLLPELEVVAANRETLARMSQREKFEIYCRERGVHVDEALLKAFEDLIESHKEDSDAT